MPLPQILYPAPTDQGFVDWAHANYQQHLAILGSLSSRFSTQFQLYQIWPAPVTDVETWLQEHAQQHAEMCGALGVVSNDLTTVDFNKPNERDAWHFLHFQEHKAVCEALNLTV